MSASQSRKQKGKVNFQHLVDGLSSISLFSLRQVQLWIQTFEMFNGK